MKAMNYISKAIRFFKNLNTRTEENTMNRADFKSTNTKFSVNLKPVLTPNNESNSLMSLMYSEENETLFI